MKNLAKYKIYAIFTLVIQLVLGFVLCIKFLSFIGKSNDTGYGVIWLLVLLIINGILFFILTVIIANKKESLFIEQKPVQFSFTDENTQENRKQTEKEVAENLDIEHYLKKLLPKEDSKTTATKYSEKVLSNFAKELDIVQGLIFIRDKGTDQFSIAGKYAYFGDTDPQGFKLGETLSGQSALNKTILYISDIPENYVTILSGLGSSSPNHLIIIPVVFNNQTIAIIELASFKEFKQSWQKLFEEVAKKIGESLNKYIE